MNLTIANALDPPAHAVWRVPALDHSDVLELVGGGVRLVEAADSLHQNVTLARGEEFFQHKLTFDRSSLTRWRQRMGEEKLVALIQESLSQWRRGPAQPSPPTSPR